MIRPPPRSTRTATLFPYTTLFRSRALLECAAQQPGAGGDMAPLEPLVPQLMVRDSSVKKARGKARVPAARSDEHTSELQSLMRISYAVFCLKKKNLPEENSHQWPARDCRCLHRHTTDVSPYRTLSVNGTT